MPLDRYWLKFPVVTDPRSTDLCEDCGHVRWRHRRGLLNSMRCQVSNCACGPQSFQYRVAMYAGPWDTWTSRTTGYRFPLSQPRPPGTPIGEPPPELGPGDATAA